MTTRPMIRIHNIETDEVIDREMTVAEFNAYKAQQEIDTTIENQAAVKETARLAILDRLGITADEAAILLG